MTNNPLAELFALIRRDLDAAQVSLEAEAGPAADEERELRHALEDGRLLVVRFAAPPADRDARARRLEMLLAAFPSVLQATPSGEPHARTPPPQSLLEELAALAQRAGALDALVIDTRSPIVWGTTGAEHSAAGPDDDDEPPSRGRLSLRTHDDAALGHAGGHQGALAGRYGLATVDRLSFDPDISALLSPALCARHGLVPLALTEGTLMLGMLDPTNAGAVEDAVLETGLAMEPVAVSEATVGRFLRSQSSAAQGPLSTPAALPEAARVERAELARATRLAWERQLASRRAILLVRGLPATATLPRGGHVSHSTSEPDFGCVARSFGGIYVLVVIFGGAFDELRAKRAVVHALPTIERLVLALPPVDPSPTTSGAVALRSAAQRRRR